MKATTLARTGPASVTLDDVEELEAAPEDDATVLFRGLRVPVSADAQVLPLHPVQVRK